MSHKCTTSHTFEYEAVGKDDPGFVECRVHFEYTPGSPETGRGYMADPAKYDPGSGCEIMFDYAEREYTDVGGDKHWVTIRAGDWLTEHCQAWLYAQDESDLENDLPDDGPDPDDARDARIDRELTEREFPRDAGGEW